MTLWQRFKRLTFWNKLSAVAAVCSVLGFLGWLLLQDGGSDVHVDIKESPDSNVQVAQNSPNAVQQHMEKSPGGIQVAGNLEVHGFSDAYRRLAPEVRQRVVSSLSRLHKPTNTSVVVTAQMGNTERLRVAEDLAGILSEAGYSAKCDGTVMMFPGDGKYPSIRINLHPSDSELVQNLVQALGPFILAEYSGKKKSSLEPGQIRIHILGEPSFAPDGRAIFDVAAFVKQGPQHSPDRNLSQ